MAYCWVSRLLVHLKTRGLEEEEELSWVWSRSTFANCSGYNGVLWGFLPRLDQALKLYFF